jgi:two-component system alkaline phosphatase synthesis response regulator PhoP
MQKTILVVDDEHDIIDLLSYNLRKEGFIVLSATNGQQAVDIASENNPDLIVLDIMMPEMDGLEVCKSLKKNPTTSNTAIIFLTAKAGEIDQIVGLELGADDYIQKPISPRVLIARIKNILRRNTEKIKTEIIAVPEIINLGHLEINRLNYTIKVDGIESFFPKKEFELLAFLAVNRGKIFSRELLLQKIWGESVYVIDRTVDVHISKIREKLGDYAHFIETVKGVGYRYKENE